MAGEVLAERFIDAAPSSHLIDGPYCSHRETLAQLDVVEGAEARQITLELEGQFDGGDLFAITVSEVGDIAFADVNAVAIGLGGGSAGRQRMKLRKAERLTGYEVQRLEESRAERVAFGAFDGDRLVAQAQSRFEELALEALVRAVYQIHCREALERVWMAMCALQVGTQVADSSPAIPVPWGDTRGG